MKYEIFPPSDELKDIVKHYMVVNTIDDIKDLLILPNGGNFIMFNRGIKASLDAFNDDTCISIPSDYSISPKTGKVKKVVLDELENTNNIDFPIIFVELLPIGFYKLFEKDASVLLSSFIEIEANISDKYFSKLYSHKTIEDEILYLNQTIKNLSDSYSNPNFRIEDILEKIDTHYNFEVKVEELVSDFDCSVSTMERRFKLMVGFTPKNYIYISKFCRTVLEYVEKQSTFNELPYIYSDSSHMNAVFHKFLGVSPSEICSRVVNQELYIYQIVNIQKATI